MKRRKLIRVQPNYKAMSWCFANEIEIFPHPLTSNGTVLAIVIRKKGNEQMEKEKYNESEVYKRISELYESEYKKANVQT